LDEDEAAFSATICYFERMGARPSLVVGTAYKTTMIPRGCKEGWLRVYDIKDGGRTLEFLHKTRTDDIPMCLAGFQGFLLAGVGKSLRLYEMGKKALLRKCENNSFPVAVQTINVVGARIIVGDVQESTFFCVYRSIPTRQLLIFADDSQPRWITCVVSVDYDTVCAADRFGNIFFNRLEERVSEKVDDDPTGAGILHEKGFLMGAAHKTDMIAHYNVGSVVTSLNKVSVAPGGREVIVYTTISGAVGALIPFISNDDVEFMTTLEMVSTESLKVGVALPFLCAQKRQRHPTVVHCVLLLTASTFAPSTRRSSAATTSRTAATTPPSRLSSTATSAKASTSCRTRSSRPLRPISTATSARSSRSSSSCAPAVSSRV